MTLVDELIVAIEDIWLEEMTRDAKHSWLWNNEDAMVSSLYFHLRKTPILRDNPLLRIWLNPSIPFKNQDVMKRPDLVIVHLPDDTHIDRKTYERYTFEKLLLAMEFKSRSQIQSYAHIEKDFQRLKEFKTEYPRVGTIFAILDDNRDYELRLNFVKEQSAKYNILALYGHDSQVDKWQIISPAHTSESHFHKQNQK